MSGGGQFRVRATPAGLGSLVYAAYWVGGAAVLGLVFGLLMEVVPHTSPAYTTFVVAQGVSVVGWLGFVVFRAVRGADFVASQRDLALRRLLSWKRWRRSPGPLQTGRFLSRFRGYTYFVGPVIVLPCDGGEFAVACISQTEDASLGMDLSEREFLSPNVVLKRDEFQRFVAWLDATG